MSFSPARLSPRVELSQLTGRWGRSEFAGCATSAKPPEPLLESFPFNINGRNDVPRDFHAALPNSKKGRPQPSNRLSAFCNDDGLLRPLDLVEQHEAFGFEFGSCVSPAHRTSPRTQLYLYPKNGF